MTDSSEDAARDDNRGHEVVVKEGHRPEPGSGRELGNALIKILSDTVFAVAGVVVTAVDKAQQFYDEQRAQAKTTGEETSVEYLVFVEAPDQVQKVATGLARGYQEMAEKGRQRILRAQTELDEDLGDGDARHDQEIPGEVKNESNLT